MDTWGKNGRLNGKSKVFQGMNPQRNDSKVIEDFLGATRDHITANAQNRTAKKRGEKQQI